MHYSFYSRTSCEVRLSRYKAIINFEVFLLTHLMRGATYVMNIFSFSKSFLLTHLMRGATIGSLVFIAWLPFLLTHLMRGATCVNGFVIKARRFYSRTSCEVRPTVAVAVVLHP